MALFLNSQVDPQKLDHQYAYIQVTYVTPFFTEKELEDRKTDFERNNNVRKFVFHTPFTKSGKSHGSITEQHMRKTALTSKYASTLVHEDYYLSPAHDLVSAMMKAFMSLVHAFELLLIEI